MFKSYYQREQVWSKDSLERRKKCLASNESVTKVQQGEESTREGEKGVEEIVKRTQDVKL
jgi:hypothetical protein